MDRVEPPGDADANGIVFVGALAMDAQALHLAGEFVVIGEHGTAVAVAAERLGREKTRRARRRQRAEPAAAIGGAESLRGIIEHEHAVLGGDGANGVVVGGQPEQIHRDDCARACSPRRLAVATARSRLVRIEIEVIGADVGKHRLGAKQHDHFRRGMESKSGADHGVAGADLPCHQHQQQRIGAARTGDRMARAAERGKLGFELAHFRTLDELTMR